MNYNVDNIIKGIFLLILALCGNFIAEILGCKTQQLLSKNMYYKHFITLTILYFAIDFNSDASSTPLDIFKISILIYILFILFSKMSIQFTILAFILLLVTYVVNNYIDYYKKNDSKNIIIQQLENLKYILHIILVIVIIIGFTLYFFKQRREHYNNWSGLTFIFGKVVCNSNK